MSSILRSSEGTPDPAGLADPANPADPTESVGPRGDLESVESVGDAATGAPPPSAPSPVPIELRLAVHDFLDMEAELLDDRRFEDWLALFADDLVYVAPVRITAKRGHREVVDDIGHFDETKQSLGMRVRRLGTDVAWAEDPPSVTRRFVTNVKVGRGAQPGELTARTYLLLYRSRGDRGHVDLLSCVRDDVLRTVGDSFLIARRRAVLDQAVLGTKNLAVFL